MKNDARVRLGSPVDAFAGEEFVLKFRCSLRVNADHFPPETKSGKYSFLKKSVVEKFSCAEKKVRNVSRNCTDAKRNC